MFGKPHRTPARTAAGPASLALLIVLSTIAAVNAAGYGAERISVNNAGDLGVGYSYAPSMSTDARYVCFESQAVNLVPGDTNQTSDGYVRDRTTDTTVRATVGIGGASPNGPSFEPIISGNGRVVSFGSWATNLVPEDTDSGTDLYVRDLQTNTTELISVNSDEVKANDRGNGGAALNATGRFVAFTSSASNLVPGDTNQTYDVFLRDRQAGTTECISLDTGGGPANSESSNAAVSADGRFVAFSSFASDLVAGDSNNQSDVFIRDRQNGTTERVSLSSGGAQGNDHSGLDSVGRLAFNADARFIAFDSRASNLVAGDTNNLDDVFIHDRTLNTTERVSINSAGAEGNSLSFGASLSADARYVAFVSWASNLDAGDTNNKRDVFRHDRTANVTERMSVRPDGGQLNNEAGNTTWISSAGDLVAFDTAATDLLPPTNGSGHVYLTGPGIPLPNRDPVANAGPDQTVSTSAANASVTLDGSASSDPDGDTLIFKWTKAGVEIAPRAAKPTINLALGTHDIQLTVTDPDGASDTDNVTILVKPANRPPVANAGADQTINPTGAKTNVTLHGNGSSDPDGDTLTYRWTVGGKQIATGVEPTVAFAPGRHEVTLTVTDPSKATDTDVVIITVNALDGPDLVGSWRNPLILNCRAQTEARGKQCSLESLTVRNAGNKKAKASKVEYYLSLDNVFNAGTDTKVGSQKVKALKAGASKTYTLKFNLPPGIDPEKASGLFLIGVLDAKKKVVEGNEGNNIVVSTPIP